MLSVSCTGRRKNKPKANVDSPIPYFKNKSLPTMKRPAFEPSNSHDCNDVAFDIAPRKSRRPDLCPRRARSFPRPSTHSNDVAQWLVSNSLSAFNLIIETFPDGVVTQSCSTDDLYAFYERRKTEHLRESTARVLKAVDDASGTIVAIAEWTFALDPKETASHQQNNSDDPPPADWPQGGNWGLRRFFKIEWERWRQEVLADKPYILLDNLVVHPAYQRRGAGSKLLAWGCEEADKHGVRICLESTPAGLNVYPQFGFKEMKVINADMKQFGWQKPYDEEAAKRYWMIREPRPHS